MIRFWNILIFCLILGFLESSAWARNSFLDSLNHRVDIKKKSRWTLADWLETKEKMRLQDQWLAANTSENFFEFKLGGSYSSLETAETGSLSASTENVFWEYKGGIFISWLGLEYSMHELEGSDTQAGWISFRLLGDAEQGTRLKVYYGSEETKQESGEKIQAPFWGADLRVYLFKYFGIQGSYAQLGSGEHSNGSTRTGSQNSYGAFIELGPLFIFGQAYGRSEDWSPGSSYNTTGVQSGVELYF